MEHTYAQDAKGFKAFCDENRLLILEMLRSGEKCACKLLENLDIGQSTLSHHMKILCDSGIVEGRIEGKWTHYSISEEGSNYAKELLNVLTNTHMNFEGMLSSKTFFDKPSCCEERSRGIKAKTRNPANVRKKL